MDLLAIWFYVFPWISIIACINLTLIVVHLWFPRPNAVTAAAHKAHREGFKDGFKTGHEDGMKEGYKAGAEDNHLEEGHFIKCPECDHAIHIPTILHVDGDPGDQSITCEPDTTELWIHIEGHKAGTIGHA
ncbi:hypothetical protein SEA_CHIPPER1996_108 [Arthrobacter phage Chipper1996]|uniref:Uncharacterized protein n=2 Tax=Klausavirus princesstrina TaxID=1984784 RepID=A0A286N4B9_9CAUD|nr:hypothetical protein SEA_TOPHAT_108 [Arthrobacter phage Tophat]QBP30479.1 hypothetical protein SEA_CHIPPER1996_108 [Arthrobacter phage Chipper1996]